MILEAEFGDDPLFEVHFQASEEKSTRQSIFTKMHFFFFISSLLLFYSMKNDVAEERNKERPRQYHKILNLKVAY